MSDTDERWQRLRELFKAALELPAGERPRFLDEHCGDDEALRAELERLLASAGAEDAEFERIVGRAAAEAAAGAAAMFQDQRVGNYRLIELLGAGGMGNVYLGERADGEFEHRVAIKLLHPARRSEELLERFRAERQVLANLEHPNIARLLDGGETTTGIPYLVMEYVDGTPVDRYCDGKKLSLVERLRLFQKICAAIDHAHRKLVVHRDIKPSNILVTADGEPKLLDFGIAKLLDENLVEFAAVTREGGGVMTPEYASPEQLRAEPISTATDIYSLGVLLYKMLCGRMPYSTAKGMRTDLARAILEDEPSRPSAALTASAPEGAETAEAISDARATSRTRLRKRLEGDLDNIVMMALRKEPERRYPSARALSLDIDNYLTHRPVSARRDSPGYRAAKFLRRYRVGAGITALLLAVLAVSSAQIVAERNRATVAALQSEEIAAFLGNLFASASPMRAQGEEISARDLLDAGVSEIAALDGQPAVQARLYEIMGTSYNWIGDVERAHELLGTTLEMRKQRLPYDPAAIAQTLVHLAENRRFAGELETAEALLREALALLREAHGERHADIAFALNRLGDVLRFRMRHEEALDALERAAAMKTALGGPDDSEAIDIYGNLALALDDLGRLEEAEAMNRRAVEASRSVLGSKHPNTIVRIGNLGLIQMRRGDYAPALANIGEAYDSIHEVWSTHPYQLFWAAHIKGNVSRLAGRFAEAREAYDEMLEIALEHYGPDDPRHATSLRALGMWYADAGRYAEALDVLERAVALAKGLDEDAGRDIPRASYRIASIRNTLGEPVAAERIARETLALGDAVPVVTRMHINRELAVAVSLQGRHDEATALIEDAVHARESFSGPGSMGMLDVLIEASRHFRRAGDPSRALEYARRAHEIAARITPAGNWSAALADAEYGYALAAAGRPGEGRALLESASADLVATFGPEDPRVRELRAGLASLGGS